jgi:hypothetical protein
MRDSVCPELLKSLVHVLTQIHPFDPRVLNEYFPHCPFDDLDHPTLQTQRHTLESPSLPEESNDAFGKVFCGMTGVSFPRDVASEAVVLAQRACATVLVSDNHLHAIQYVVLLKMGNQTVTSVDHVSLHGTT